ncbi:toxin glutamine deamidase domain-containing protein [Kitasatospora sp. NBC_00315]|uniref:toxin glutamine deamidase domain-containing protein n=1 Tax=Kitasatospora sp. NBC_00315 TaxID=2975963 RepID=UPI00324EC786
MSRKLPEELVPVLAQLHQAWPLADEDGLRQAAAKWREFGAESERLGRRGGASAGRVTGENSGRSVDAFADHWRTFSGSGRGHLDDAQHAADLMAAAFDTAARATDTCKAELVSTLTALAEELKKADDQAAAVKDAAAKASAAASTQPAKGVFGAVAQTVGAAAAGVRAAAADTVAAGVRTVALEAAKLKVAGLLEELGRAMKAAMGTALKEPALTAMERIAAVPGAGGSSPGGDIRTLAEVANGTGGLPVGLAAAGVVGADGSGLTMVVDAEGRPVIGEDGKPVVGVDGLTVKLDAAGQPELGADGNPVIVRADGTEVKDTDGLKLVVGKDGKPVVAVEGVTVGLDENGRPQLGPDGHPVLNGPDGRPLATGGPLGGAPGGRPPLGTVLNGLPTDGLLTDGPATDGVLGPLGGHGRGPGPGSGEPVGLPGGGPAATGPIQIQTGPVGVQLGSGGGGGGGGQQGGWTGDAPVSRPAPAGSGRSGGYGPVSAPAGGGYDYTPGPVASGGGGGPASLRTDSVLAPPSVDSASAYGAGGGSGAGYSGGSGGGYSGSGYDGGSGGAPVGAASGGIGAGGGFGGGQTGGSAGAPGGGYGGGAVPVSGGGGFASGGAVGGAPGGAGAGGVGPVGGQAYGAAPGAPGAGGVGGVGGASAVPAAGSPGSGAVGGVQPGQDTRPGAGVGAGSRPGAVGAQPGPVGVAPVLTPGPGRSGGEGAGFGGNRRFAEPVAGEGVGSWATPVATAQVMAMHIALGRRGHPGEEPGAPAGSRGIADSRPSGLPGGLGPVDPEHQAEVERRVPRGPDGLPVRHPDPAAGGWAEVVNDGGYRGPGRANNGLEIALSAVDTYSGRPTCAAPRIPTEGDAGERGGRDRAERELGAPFRDLGDGAGTFERLAGELLPAGHGAQAVLLTLDAYGRSHAWNAVNHQGAIVYLDHQSGCRGPAPLHSADHGLWAIALDPDGRALDLAEHRARPASPAVPPADPAAVPAAPPAVAADPAAVPAVAADPVATKTPSARSTDS